MGFVKYEQDGFVGVITINRPEALNALNTEVIQDLRLLFLTASILVQQECWL